jgi:hypothetical protein
MAQVFFVFGLAIGFSCDADVCISACIWSLYVPALLSRRQFGSMSVFMIFLLTDRP